MRKWFNIFAALLSSLFAVSAYLILVSSATILFYCANELISICENAAKMGLPLPKKLTECLKNFRKDLQQNEYFAR